MRFRTYLRVLMLRFQPAFPKHRSGPIWYEAAAIHLYRSQIRERCRAAEGPQERWLSPGTLAREEDARRTGRWSSRAPAQARRLQIRTRFPRWAGLDQRTLLCR